MKQRVLSPDRRIRGDVSLAVKQGMRTHPAWASDLKEVDHRVDIAGIQRVSAQVIIGGEQGIGLAALGGSELQIVAKGIHSGLGQVRIFAEVILCV